jgi:hypothetical protein
MNPKRKLKNNPEPTNNIMAKDRFPSRGILAYHSILVGKSHKKSDIGPIKSNILLIPSNTAFMHYLQNIS